jgi:hypothetical protein
MYIEKLDIENIRTFAYSTISFIHPDMSFGKAGFDDPKPKNDLPRPRLPNVNLLLGDNASGKTTVLQAIALTALGPAAREAQLPLPKLVRYPSGLGSDDRKGRQTLSYLLATFRMHEPEGIADEYLESMQQFERRGELERMEFAGIADEVWAPVFNSANDAFFCVAYGSNRRVESVESPEPGMPYKNWFERGQRVQGVFQDGFPLYRLANWLPKTKAVNQKRYKEVSSLLEKMIGPGHFNFTGVIKNRDYCFKRSETSVPFPELSDGYRGFIGWVGDLLYHLCFACPDSKSLTEISGIVMVDEIDLLLHPKWQMKAISTVARALPRMQFIFTSHSPLVASSLEWMNIILLKVNAKANRTTANRLRERIHGLDADQVLISEFFGLSTTRAKDKATKLDELTVKARHGDEEAAKQLIAELANGSEDL